MDIHEIECYYFEMFRKVYPLPSGTINYRDKPDVILDGTQKIGIEITRFYGTDGSNSESEQAQRERRETAVYQAQHLYEQASGKNFQLAISLTKIIRFRTLASW